MMPVPYYQVVEFLDWLKRDSNTNLERTDRGSLTEYAMMYLQGRPKLPTISSLLSFADFRPYYVIRALLYALQACPRITEGRIDDQLKHFAQCGQCVSYLRHDQYVSMHPLMQLFLESNEFEELTTLIATKARDSPIPQPQKPDAKFQLLIELFGADFARKFEEFISKMEASYLLSHYASWRHHIRYSDRPYGSAWGYEFTVRGGDGISAIDTKRRRIEAEAERLAESVRLLSEGHFYEEQIRNNPYVLEYLRDIGVLAKNSAQALEFIWWLEEKHPKLDILANVPAEQLFELVASFCEEKNYSNVVSFSKEVLNWVQGEGERSILQKLTKISSRLRRSRGVASRQITPFKRYSEVPFHGIFLFLSVGNFPQFIKQYWEDLNFLTGDYLDVYYSLEDLERGISAYETLSEFRTLQIEQTKLPALVLWKDSVSESCVISLYQLAHRNIFEVVTLIVERIAKGDDINEICRVANGFVKEKIEELLPGIRVSMEKGVFTMGDNYNVGQAGAVGPHSHAHDMSFQQLWSQSEDNIDLEKLAGDLALLRAQLKQEATEAEHDLALGQVAAAEVAAKNGNGAEALERLAKAGKWVLDVATKIGVPVAVEALKAALSK